MSSVQVSVALDKEKHPERYCPHRRCLWRTGGGHCPRHNYAEPFDYPKTRNEQTGE